MRGHPASPLPAAAPTPQPSGGHRSPVARIAGVVAAVSISLFGATLAATGASAGRPESAPPTTDVRVSATDTIPDDTSGDVDAPDGSVADDSTPAGDGEPIPPDGLGDDAELDALADDCFGGDLLACDLLFLAAPVDSAYEEYGDTCGGRQPAGTEDYCALGTDGTGTTNGGDGQPVPPGDLGDDPLLDELAANCYAGDMQACDDLYWESPLDSAYEDYGNTCGGRVPDGAMTCTDLADPVPGTGDVPVDTGDVPVDTGEPPIHTVPTNGEIPAPTVEPTGLGTDPQLDALAQACYDGDMTSCDDLYNASASGSAYEEYGDTCAGRQPTGTGRYCVSSFPGGSVDTTPVSTAEVPATTVFVPPPPTTTGSGPSLPPLPSLPVTTLPAVSVPPTASAAPTVPPLPTVGPPTVVPGATTVPDPTPATVPDPTPTTVAPGTVPPATLEPTGLGTDPMLDSLAQSCFDGDMEACDQLWRDSEPGSAYRDYGDSCAGRQELDTAQWCVVSFPGTSGPPTTVVSELPTTTPTAPTVAPGTGTVPGTATAQLPAATLEPTGLGTDATLDALAQACYAGDMESCDRLFDDAPFNSPYQQYGDTCAGRQPTGTFLYCVAAFPVPK